MIASLERHLKNKSYSLSIVCDREFSSSKQVLDGKAKQLRLAGRGKLDGCPKRRKKFSGRARNSVVKLQNPWFIQCGGCSPNNLVSVEGRNITEWDWRISESWKVTMALNLLSLLKCQRKPDLEVWTQSQDNFSPKCSRLAERDVQLRYFAGTSAVGLPYLRTGGPFYLSIKYNRGSSDEIWYKVQPMGEN